MIAFRVPAVPVAQPRQRHRVLAVAGRTFAQNYTPAKHPVQAFKATVRLALQEVYTGPPLAGPLFLRVTFMMPRPSNMIWKTRPMPLAPHTKRPDLDNLLKSVKDALSGLAWTDDCQVCELKAEKMYADGRSRPEVFIEIDTFTLAEFH